jgi:hypothetical protein
MPWLDMRGLAQVNIGAMEELLRTEDMGGAHQLVYWLALEPRLSMLSGACG